MQITWTNRELQWFATRQILSRGHIGRSRFAPQFGRNKYARTWGARCDYLSG